MAERINLLVIEDEESIRLEYENLCGESEDIFLVGTTAHTDEAVKLAEEFCPNAVVLDLELHKGSGNGLDFLLSLADSKMRKKPFIMVVTNNISPTIHSVARKRGVDFIITKDQSDYSVKMVLDMLRSLCENVPETESPEQMSAASKQKIEKDYNKRLQAQIVKELDMIGISPKLKGRDYLTDAIFLICQKRRTSVCAEIAEKYSKTDASVERAMQNAINRAWRTTDIETLERCYSTYINPKRGVPTLTEFIFYYAEKVKKNA